MNYVVREVYEAFMAASNLRRAPKGMRFIAVVTVVLLASLPTAAVKGQDRAQQPSAQASGESSGTDGGQIEAQLAEKAQRTAAQRKVSSQLLDARRAADARSLLFRRYNSEGVPTGEAGVNAAPVPATRFVTFAEQGEGQFGTGVAYANPSATAAHVTFTARDAAGQMLASVVRTLLPGGHDAHGMASLFGLTSFTGSLEVTSTEPIVSLSVNFEADPVFSSLPPGEPDAAAQGSTTYYFPHLAVGASWQTAITYINYSPEEVTCQTDFLSDYGSPLMVSFAGLGMVVSRTDVLPPGGSVHEETNVELSAPLAPGWARATCSGPVKASLLFRRRNSEGSPTAEAGVNATAVPAARFVTFAEQGEGQFGTGVAYANPSATAAHVTFTARDAAGQMLASVDRTLLPGGHDAHGMASLFGLTSFTGSIEVTSTVPIVSLSLNFEADPVFSSLPPGEPDAAAQ